MLDAMTNHSRATRLDRPSIVRQVGLAVVLGWSTILAGPTACMARSPAMALHPTGAPAQVTPPDTARGIIAVVGADPVTQVMLGRDRSRIVLRGPLRQTLARLSGMEVWVEGAAGAPALGGVPTLIPARFIVRAIDGRPVVDGVLEVSARGIRLVGQDGAVHSIDHVPAALAELAGHRVWVLLNPRGHIELFGDIDPTPNATGP